MGLTGSKSVYLTAAPGISPYSQRTIALWVKMPPTATATNSLFSLYYGVSFGYQFNLHFAGNPTPNVFGAIAQSNNGTTIDGTGLSGIANAPWHFILATFDNGGVTGNVKTVSIYYDGVLSQAVTVGGPVTQLVDDDPGSTNYVWAGSTDGGAQVAYPMVWKRILTQGEITALAVSGADPRTVAPAQLVSFAQLNQGSGTIPSLVGSLNWVVTGGTFTVVADPFPLSMPTTLERASFANQIGGRVNLTLASLTGITVGTSMTVTKPDGSTLTGDVKKFVGSTGIKLGVTAVSKPSGLLILPKGSTLA